jgi:hypothetical protein
MADLKLVNHLLATDTSLMAFICGGVNWLTLH